MDRRKIGSIMITISITSMIFLMILTYVLSFFDALSGMALLGIIFAFFLFISAFVISLILILIKKKGLGERNDYNGLRRKCLKCNSWIDIRTAVRPCVVKCKKCNEPVLLDIEEENVKVQCPKCMTQQVQHIKFRPAEVPCKEFGITLLIPRKY